MLSPGLFEGCLRLELTICIIPILNFGLTLAGIRARSGRQEQVADGWNEKHRGWGLPTGLKLGDCDCRLRYNMGWAKARSSR